MHQNPTSTPFPLRGHVAELNPETAALMRELRERLMHPASLEGEAPERLAAYCLDLLELCPEASVDQSTLDALHPFRSVSRTPPERLTPEVLSELLDTVLKRAWCRATAVAQKRQEWSEEQPWVGQEVVTALLLNEVFGGQVVHVRTHDEIPLVWNHLETGIPVNPAHRTTLPSEGKPVNLKILQDHRGFQASLELLREQFVKSVSACGVAAACLAEQQGWKAPKDNWSAVG